MTMEKEDFLLYNKITERDTFNAGEI